LGNGDGTFSAGVSYDAGGTNALAVSVGDVNGDGKVDVIVAIELSQQQRLFYRIGKRIDEQWRRHPPVRCHVWLRRTESQYVALRRRNGDGKFDIVAANNCASNNNCSNGSVGVLLNNGDAHFQNAIAYNATGSGTLSLRQGDLNNDGKADLVGPATAPIAMTVRSVR